MDYPKSASAPEESSSNYTSEKQSFKVSPSLGRSLVDLTKQFLNWPHIDKAHNFTVEENSSEIEKTEQDVDVYSLAKAQWTPKWPEHFNESALSVDTDQKQKCEEDAHQNVKNIEEENDEGYTHENDKNNDENSHEKDQEVDDIREIEYNDEETDQDDEGYVDPSDQEELYQNDSEMDDREKIHHIDLDHSDKETDSNDHQNSSEVSLNIIGLGETLEEMDKEIIRIESSEDEQSDLAPQDDADNDVPVLVLKIPSLIKSKDDSEDFDNILYDIPYKDADEDVSDSKKWFVAMGDNRNYIKALINYDVDFEWKKNIESKEDLQKEQDTRKFKWNINYDNMNYIRSLLRPEIFERVLQGDLFKRSDKQYRKVLYF